jgi:hypothetical protein
MRAMENLRIMEFGNTEDHWQTQILFVVERGITGTKSTARDTERCRIHVHAALEKSGCSD